MKGLKGKTLAARTKELREKVTAYLDDDKVEQLLDMLLYKALNEHDVVAARELLDRALGKAKDIHELSGPNGGPIAVAHAVIDYRTLSNEELASLKEMALKAGAAPTRSLGSTDVLEAAEVRINGKVLLPERKAS